MSDSEDDIPLVLLAKKEKRREQWRTSQKRKRDVEKTELNEAKLAKKRLAESDRVKKWIEQKKAEDPDGFREKMRLVKQKYRANMSGYKRRWVRQKDATAKQVKRAEVHMKEKKAETKREQNIMKVKMWRTNKKTPLTPETSPSPTASNSTSSVTRGGRKKGTKVRRVLSSIKSPTQKAKLLASVVHFSSPRTKKNLKDLHVLADEGDRLALEGVVNAADELRKRRDDDAVRAKHVLKMAANAAGATGLDRKSAREHLSKTKSSGPSEFKWVTYDRSVRSDALPESTCHDYDSAVSRELPLKKEVVRIKTGPKQYTGVPKRMLEVTLSEAYGMFVKQHGKLLGQRKYEILRPREVLLPRLSLRLVM